MRGGLPSRKPPRLNFDTLGGRPAAPALLVWSAVPDLLPPHLYPDVVHAGSLAELFRRLLADSGTPIRCTPCGTGHARISCGPRTAEITLAVRERSFQVTFWSAGAAMLIGSTPEPQLLARAAAEWLVRRPTTAELAQAFPFARPDADAEAYENGTITERRWREYLAAAPVPQLAPLIEAASREPMLRRLFPFTSMWTLSFSRCTGFPYTTDCPAVTPVADLYVVRRPDGTESAPLDCRAAVRALLDALPVGCGPAQPGTAGDLV